MTTEIKLPTVYANYEVEKTHRDQLQTEAALRERDFVIECMSNDGYNSHVVEKTRRGQLKTEKALRDHDWIIEYLSNDHSHIDWVRWFRLPFWKPREAIYLLNSRDPSRPHENMGDYYSEKIEKLLELVNRQIHAGILKELISPEQWIQWARNYQIPLLTPFTKFLQQIEDSTPDADHNDKEGIKTNGQNKKPWLEAHPDDPEGAKEWHKAAWYFSRKVAKDNPDIIDNRDILSDKVLKLLIEHGCCKRGGKEPPEVGTVKRILYRIKLSKSI